MTTTNTLPFGLQTILPGTKFKPSKTNLISFYLYNKVFGLQSETEASFITDCDLYADKEPWEIFPDSTGSYDDEDDAVNEIYCFTRLKKMSARKIGRSVGKGTWHAEGKPDGYKVKICGNLYDACHKRYLYKNEDSEHHKRWSLHEYSCRALSDDVVICNLQKNEGKCPKKRKYVAPVASEEEEEPKRMRFEAANSEIVFPASSSRVDDTSAAFSFQEDNLYPLIAPDNMGLDLLLGDDWLCEMAASEVSHLCAV